ncbi:nuclear transport factor 2 family protein [Gordonia sp. NPDC003376]
MISTATTDLAIHPNRHFASWNQRDIEKARDPFAPTLPWTNPLLPAPLTSREGARGFLVFGWEEFPDLRFEPVGRPLVDEVARTEGPGMDHDRLRFGSRVPTR